MTTNEYVRAFAGAFVLISLALGVEASPLFVSKHFLWVTGFVGLNLFQGFLKAVKEMFGTTRGCAHLSELLMFLPTAALQTFASEVLDNDDSAHKPYQLDRCHALVSHSEAVQRYYPRWYRPHKPRDRDPA